MYISLFLFHHLVCIYVQYLLDVVRSKTSKNIYLLELIKRRSIVHENNMSREHALNFDQ